MIYSVETSTALETVKADLESKAKSFGFGVLKQYAFKDILKEKNFPIERDITVYELCNPQGAQSALESMPEISVFLPCRLSVYEQEGKTIIATIEMDQVMKQSAGVAPELHALMEDIYAKLKALMSAWS